METRTLPHPPAMGANAVSATRESRPYPSDVADSGMRPQSAPSSAVKQCATGIFKRLAIATAIAAICAVAWAGPTNVSFGTNLGGFLVIFGFALMISRAETPGRERPTLTSLGAFLFVSVPMITGGALLM